MMHYETCFEAPRLLTTTKEDNKKCRNGVQKSSYNIWLRHNLSTGNTVLTTLPRYMRLVFKRCNPPGPIQFSLLQQPQSLTCWSGPKIISTSAVRSSGAESSRRLPLVTSGTTSGQNCSDAPEMFHFTRGDI